MFATTTMIIPPIITTASNPARNRKSSVIPKLPKILILKTHNKIIGVTPLIKRLINFLHRILKPAYLAPNRDSVGKPKPTSTIPPKEIVSLLCQPNITESLKEESQRAYWLPKPITHRVTRNHSYKAPAEQHRNAITRSMRGKSKHSPFYRKTIKKSPKIRVEEETMD